MGGGTAVLTVRFTCDSADANGAHPFAEATINVVVVAVEFQTAAGGALASPLRVGITAAGHDRRQSLRAVVTPASEAPNVTLSAGANLAMSDVVRSGNTITFKLVGTARSAARGDTDWTATYSGGTVDHPVTVVVPAKVGTPHDTVGGGLVSANRLLDATTSPAAPFVPAGQVLRATVHLRFTTITVIDQFNHRLGNIYVGATVTEGGANINQPLSATGTDSDPVGVAAFLTATVPAGSPAALAWPTQPLLSISATTVNTLAR